MDKVYLVLRNNQQTGPFTIGELLQQQLRPSDMIWVEGKSTAWTYISELELTPFVQPPATTLLDAAAAMGGDEIENKAEELRRRVLSSAPKTYFPTHTTEIEHYASPYKISDDIEFVDHRKERKKYGNTVMGEVFLTCVVAGLFVVGIYKGKSLLATKNQVPETVATQLQSNTEHTAQNKKQVQVLPSVSSDSSLVVDSSAALGYKPRPVIIKKHQADSGTIENLSAPITVVPPLQEEKKEEPETTKTVSKVPDEIPAKKEVITAEKENTAVPKEEEEKKGFLKGIFKKKRKE